MLLSNQTEPYKDSQSKCGL